MPLKLIAALLSLAALGPLAAAADTPAPLRPIATLDAPRYLGTWYEIAKYPNRFQKMCAKNTRAEYSKRPDNSLQVINRCQQVNGEISQVIGAARQLGDASSPKLKVRFAPEWLSFLPLVWANYWVIDLDADYQLAAVSEPGRDYLWVLSRSPQVNPQAYAALLERLSAQGFDLSKLELSPQDSAPAPR